MLKLFMVLLSFNLIFQKEVSSSNDLLKFQVKKVETDIDETYGKFKITIKKNNEGNPLIDIEMDVFKDVVGPIMINFELLKEDDGVYDSVIKTSPRNLCDLFDNPEMEPLVVAGFDGLKNHGNFATSCPYKLGHYYIKDFLLDQTKFPEEKEPGKFRVDVRINIPEMLKDKPVARLNWFMAYE